MFAHGLPTLNLHERRREASRASPFGAARGFLDAIARELGLRERHVREAVALMDEECTVPFIARYRKEATGAWTSARFDAWRIDSPRLDKLEQRRDAILAALEKSGDLNPALARAVAAADTPTRLEDLYLPHRPKRATRASAALDLGLGPLADDLLDPSTPYSRGFIRRFVEAPGVADADAAMRGARDIVAEKAGEWRRGERSREARVLAHGQADRQGGARPKPGSAKAKAGIGRWEREEARCERGGGGGDLSGSERDAARG